MSLLAIGRSCGLVRPARHCAVVGAGCPPDGRGAGNAELPSRCKGNHRNLAIQHTVGMRAASAPLERRQVRGALNALRAKPHTVVVSNLDDLFGGGVIMAVEVLRGSDDHVARGGAPEFGHSA